MGAIHLKLPDELVRESSELAKELGITRAELIRGAITHEIAAVRARQEREAMAAAFIAMSKDRGALRASEELEQSLDDPLPADDEGWWRS
jgi:metal-responsive CopG/Arc/MetJ family transcriptional regulator